jgi:hypothetical protein
MNPGWFAIIAATVVLIAAICLAFVCIHEEPEDEFEIDDYCPVDLRILQGKEPLRLAEYDGEEA